jgi:hypothetical protein
MKVMNINGVAYQILRVYPYIEEHNIAVYTRTGNYEVTIKNDKIQQLYFCDRIQDAEFSDATETKKLESVDILA